MPSTLIAGTLQLTRAGWELLDEKRGELSRGAFIEQTLSRIYKVKLPERPEKGRYERRRRK